MDKKLLGKRINIARKERGWTSERQCGVTEFQVACDPGVGLYAGEIVNITKQNDEAMRLVCVTPFEYATRLHVLQHSAISFSMY